MSKSLQDQFIDDDEEETCPLCVEEFDLTDKGFRPCECGYQICQFCYHNVKNNMNGLCPACRRPYDDAKIQYKVITPEETAAHKARQAQKAKKTQAAAQKEKAKAEADNMSRKHLAGLRVVQKNLVYVTGLSPTMQEDQLLQTLRGEQYFGQYGKIIKIVVSKAKDPSNPHSVGVYVTYERKEDAASCIAAVDGAKNGDRTLRAQFGTTKYCSSYLRGEQCLNRNCMFLHEPGEANESYSRAELSAHNAGSSQHGRSAPPPQPQQPVASAAPPMARQPSIDHVGSPPNERPALPSTASWASKPAHPARSESRAASVMTASPAISNAIPVPVPASVPVPTPTPAPAARSTEPTPPAPGADEPEQETNAPNVSQPSRTSSQISPLLSLVKGFKLEDLKFIWSSTILNEAEMNIVSAYPPLFDQNGGQRRRVRRQREEEQRRMEQEVQDFQQPPTLEAEEDPELSGSLQLGGEPEERQNMNQMQSAIHPPGSEGVLDPRFQFGGDSLNPSASDRTLTQQQLLLQTLKPGAQSTYTGPAQQGGAPGHQRNASRYSFANDTATASTSVKPVANAKLMNQQSSMMPSNITSSQFSGVPPHGQFYTSNVQGPPPGLKTTGTPPVSGNLTFGQGHGFATGGLQYGAPGATGATRTQQQDQYYQSLLRGGAGDGKQHDADFPPLGPTTFDSVPGGRRTRQQSIADIDESRRSTPPVPPGFEAAHESRRSTPAIPPGLSRPTALPDLDGLGGAIGSRPGSRPSSRASLRRAVSNQILQPVLPLRPATPSAVLASPVKEERHVLEETPTKASRWSKGASTLSSLRLADEVDDKKDSKTAKASVEADVQPTASDPVAVSTKAPEHEDTPEIRGAKVKSETISKLQGAGASPSPTRSIPKPASPVKTTEPDEHKSKSNVIPAVPEKVANKQTNTPKRKPPGKLDITAAVLSQRDSVKEAASVPTELSTPQKLRASGVAITPSAVAKAPESPSTGVSSPAFKTAPRTLRVVQTPKTETLPGGGVAVASAVPAGILANKFPSRQPSVGSIDVPGTPTSEHISNFDALSMASTSQSRANSPPPLASKIGSAPIRTKTKSQLKKERQERAKANIEQEIGKPEEEKPQSAAAAAQEAIVSRKKKAKKESQPKPKPKAVPASIETSDNSQSAIAPATHEEEDAHRAAQQQNESKPATPIKTGSAPPKATPPPREPSPPPTPTALTAEQLISDLKAHAPEIQKCIDSLFKFSNSSHFKFPANISAKDLAATLNFKSDLKVNLSKQEVEDLLNGKIPAVHYTDGPQDGNNVWLRGMVSGSGAHLRALTKELESRFIELEKALRDLPEEFRFKPSKPQNETKFPTVDLHALKRQFDSVGSRGVSVMEQMVQDGATMRKGAFLVDEASKYINEFVMPPVTPPPSLSGREGKGGNHMAGGGGNVTAQQHHQQQMVEHSIIPTLEVAERHLSDAKRQAEEKEIALRKQIKKNKKVFGINN